MIMWVNGLKLQCIIFATLSSLLCFMLFIDLCLLQWQHPLQLPTLPQPRPKLLRVWQRHLPVLRQQQPPQSPTLRQPRPPGPSQQMWRRRHLLRLRSQPPLFKRVSEVGVFEQSSTSITDTKHNKKLIRRWDSERELSLRRHRTPTTKYNKLVHKFRHRSTRLCVGTHVYQIQWNNAI